MARDDILLDIARRWLFLETLETRNSDRLDFRDQAVWSIKAALQEAYEAGRNSVLFSGGTQPSKTGRSPRKRATTPR